MSRCPTDRSHCRRARPCFARQQGFSLIELSIAILIALFLIGGVLVVEQGVHRAYADQSGLGQLQDEERFAMSLLTQAIQQAGYFPDPTINSLITAMPASGTTFVAGQALYAPVSGSAAPHDSLYVRFMSSGTDGIGLCDGTTAANLTYTTQFYVAKDANGTDYDLYCQIQPGTGAAVNTAVPLVKGITDMQIMYGVHTTGADYNVDTYALAGNVTNWSNVTSIRVKLTFANPLHTSQPSLPATVTFTREINLMSRVGVNTL